jgi:hypothetical protein
MPSHTTRFVLHLGCIIKHTYQKYQVSHSSVCCLLMMQQCGLQQYWYSEGHLWINNNHHDTCFIHSTKPLPRDFTSLISNFHHVLNVVCFLLGDSPASIAFSCFTVGPVGAPIMGTAAYRLNVPHRFRVSLVSARRIPHTDVMRGLWQRKGEL